MGIQSTPDKAPFPVDEYLKPTALERSNAEIQCDQTSNAPCSIPVNVGLFFDGTNNHMDRDRNGQREPEQQIRRRHGKAGQAKTPFKHQSTSHFRPNPI